ncbi:ABC transporter permease [Flavihumibacter sp. CACIAM 22H1]|uniref:ABC transporter permease n=1 Tax=Flavihumibacter sp. CACIAM 22H1 TaxID=1812911 RepID=UPI0007A87256|nr:ABC transporter permease [Flavihumibacter sp. CACIAM 22H1]KYP16526.1 MAG: hypothetical protein A1D16_13730 [Flavihumibacter sp. CACIAM 22H1]
MIHLLKTEWLKINRYPAFWLLLGICMITYPGINLIFLNVYQEITQKESTTGQIVTMLLGNPFSFPEVWKTSAFLSSVFVFIPAILIIMLITNEYNYKTSRQNIIDGWSRTEFMWAKAIDVLLITAIVTVMYATVAFFMGLQNTVDSFQPFEQVYYVGLFALQTFSQLSLAFLIGLLVRKAFIAMAIFLFYGLIAEPIAVNLLKYKFKSGIGRFFPMEISDRLIPAPAFMSKMDEAAYQASLDAISSHIFLTLGLLALTWLIVYQLYLKRDL